MAIDVAGPDHPDLYLAAIREEFQQLEDKGAYQPVCRADATNRSVVRRGIELYVREYLSEEHS